MIQVASIHFYPIKACRGFEIPSILVQRMGLENDRRMMVVTPEGEFLTQREFPRLALVTPALKDGMLMLSAPDFDSIQLVIRTTGPALPVRIWRSTGISAIDQGEEAATWFSDWLRSPVRLVHIQTGYKRRLDPTYAISPDDHTGFADGYPVLIVSEESLNDLNGRLAIPLPMDRFRPNLVVKGCDPFAEDTWKQIRIGDLQMAVVKPCPRCVVTTIDKRTLRQDKEPLKTLSTFRKQAGGVMFGQNAIPLNEAKITVGMDVQIVQPA